MKTMPFGALKQRSMVVNGHQHQVAMKTMPFGALKRFKSILTLLLSRLGRSNEDNALRGTETKAQLLTATP